MLKEEEREYLVFVDKFVKKYNLDNILQKDLNYVFSLKFTLQNFNCNFFSYNVKNGLFKVQHKYLLKIINTVLKILGFQDEIKNYIIFIKYKTYFYEIIENEEFNFFNEFNLYISFQKEKEYISNVIFKEDNSPGLFFKLLEDFFFLLGKESLDNDKHLAFLRGKMSDEELYSYLEYIYLKLKVTDDILVENKISYFKYVNNIEYKINNVMDGWMLIDYLIFYNYIGEIFHSYIVPLLGNFNIDKLGTYRYGLMKGYGSYNYLDIYTLIPFLTYYDGFISYTMEELNWYE